MRTLLQKNTRYLLTWLPVVLLICCIVFYVLMQMQAHHMQIKQLQLKQLNVWTAFLRDEGKIELSIPGEYEIVQVTHAPAIEEGVLRDTTIFLPQKGMQLPFEVLTGRNSWKGNTYNVSAYVSSTEIYHLIIKVFLTEAVILGLLLLSIIWLNKKSSGLLWKPFFSTLKQVNDFDIIRNQSVVLPVNTSTAEFDELNKVFTELIKNVTTAYHNQKQFVENASHEMQTPLAIIRSKLELLINYPELTEKAAAQLADITAANDRLSQMNRTLLLLAKIENNQFPYIEKIDLSDLLRKDVNTLKTHYDDHFPQLKLHITEGVTLHANRSLLVILIHNLINNAVEHNVQEGTIAITLTPESLRIENTGLPPIQPTDELFERFRKGTHHTKTTGLGLALVKQICILYHYRVSYTYSNGLHKLEFFFFS